MYISALVIKTFFSYFPKMIVYIQFLTLLGLIHAYHFALGSVTCTQKSKIEKRGKAFFEQYSHTN